MKNIILLILFLITTFVLNIIFYYNSSDYRDFLRGLKNEDDISEEVTTKDLTNIKQKIEQTKNKKISEEVVDTEITEVFEPKNEVKQKKIPAKTEVKLGKNYIDILEKFKSYELEKLQFNTNLFDITNEYPDSYFEYYSRDVTLYFFPTKTYGEVLDIFTVLETELPFSVNETKPFGDASFYINLDKDIDDGIVRLVIQNKSVILGLKIKKTEYNRIKKILDTLK